MLVVLVINDNRISSDVKDLANDIYAEFEDVTGVSVNYNMAKSNVILGDVSQSVIGKDYVEEKLSDVVFKISSDTFFQVNPKCANLMFDYIKNYVKNNFDKPSVFDAYAGIAAFGIALHEVASEVVSVELNSQSIKKAEENIEQYGIKNVTPICADTLKYLESCDRKFDITIVDPPRKGCDLVGLEKVLEITKDLLVYVSCNPATLARDLDILSEKYTISTVTPVDMFPNTQHIECVVRLCRTSI